MPALRGARSVAMQHEGCVGGAASRADGAVSSDARRCQNPASLPEGMGEVEREPSYA